MPGQADMSRHFLMSGYPASWKKWDLMKVDLSPPNHSVQSGGPGGSLGIQGDINGVLLVCRKAVFGQSSGFSWCENEG